MKTFFAFLVLVVFGSIFYGTRFFLLLQKSKTLVEEAQPFEKVGDPGRLPFLFAGDSTGVGVGSHDQQKTLAGYFSRDFPLRSIKNLSKSGRRTQELVSVLLKEPDRSADLVVLQIGGNDILYFTPEIKLRSQIEDALKEAKRVGRHTVLITSGNVGLAPFFPKLLGTFWTQKSRRVRALFQERAEAQSALYIDLFEERESDLFLTDVSRYYSEDLLHPSGEGYGYWYEKTRAAVRVQGWEGDL